MNNPTTMMTTGAADAGRPVLAAAPRDFPDWLPPMLVKELRQGLRLRGFAATFVLVPLTLVVACCWVLVEGGTGGSAAFVEGVFWATLGGVVGVFTPLRAFGALRAEQEQRSLDLLVLTRLTPWRIVLGKWASLQVQALLFAVTLLPWGVARYFFGTFELGRDALALGFIFAGGAVLTAVGVWASTLPKLARILLPIGAIVGLQTIVPALVMLSMGRAMGGSSFVTSTFGAGSGGGGVAVLAGYLLLAAGVALHGAVARIAPPAHNHALVPRAMVALGMLGGGLAALLGGNTIGAQALGLAGAALVVLGVGQLADGRPPWAIHARPWIGRGWVRAAVGRCVIPGLRGALWWWAAVLALGAALHAGAYAVGAMKSLSGLELLPALSAALLLPAVLVRALLPPALRRLPAYVGCGVLLAVVAALVHAAPGSPGETVLWPLVRGLPGLGLFMWGETGGDTVGWIIWDGVLAVVLWLWGFWLTRAEGRHYALWRRAARGGAGEPPPLPAGSGGGEARG